MIRAALAGLVGLVLAFPAQAYERMQRSDCRDALSAGAAAIGLDQADIYAADNARHVVTADGWCRLFGDDPMFSGAPFATLDWRAEGISRLTVEGRPPEALEIRIEDWRTEPGDPLTRGANRRPAPVDATLSLRHVQDSRQLILESLRIGSDAGDELFLTAVFERVDFSSAAMAQVSLGSVALGRLNARATLNGWVENRVLPSLEIEGDPQAVRRMVRDGIDLLPGHLFDTASQANLDAFLDALPAPRGTLELGLRSDSGMMFSGVGALFLFGRALDTADPATALLDGVHVDVIWTPDPNQTE
jgi:hypothetical protein